MCMIPYGLKHMPKTIPYHNMYNTTYESNALTAANMSQ